MKTFPRVSIITPSFNQAIYLDECIRSVLDQNYPNIEYIIMDGGSTDGSVEIIKQYESKLAFWVSRKDAGQSAAINEGIEHATGEIWAWMNADDAYLPGAVMKAVDWFYSHPEHDILYGDCIVVGEDGRGMNHLLAEEFDVVRMITVGTVIPSGSTFLRKGVFDRMGGLDASLHYGMDTDYWLRLSRVCKFGHLSEDLSIYRVYPLAKTWDVQRGDIRARELIQIYSRFWDQTDLPTNILGYRSKSLAIAYLYAADLASQRGDKRACLGYMRKGLQFGLSAIQPRLVRLFLYLLFSIRPSNPHALTSK